MAPVIEAFEPRLFDGAVADEILASVEERLTEKKRCNITLAGGSTPGGRHHGVIARYGRGARVGAGGSRRGEGGWCGGPPAGTAGGAPGGGPAGNGDTVHRARSHRREACRKDNR